MLSVLALLCGLGLPIGQRSTLVAAALSGTDGMNTKRNGVLEYQVWAAPHVRVCSSQMELAVHHCSPPAPFQTLLM